MCLFSNQKKKIAKEDIICYKIVDKLTDNHYMTPFQHMNVSLNTEYVDTTPENDDLLTFKQIKGGYYHSFKDKDNALKYIQDFGSGACVLKGIIPKGSEYYEGIFIFYYNIPSDFLSAYASKKIKYIEEINYNEKTI